jgi:hypothetical protein
VMIVSLRERERERTTQKNKIQLINDQFP